MTGLSEQGLWQAVIAQGPDQTNSWQWGRGKANVGCQFAGQGSGLI